MKTTISAPGKVILSGEHAVVYGKPALVAAVNRRMNLTIATGKNTIELSGTSTIPVGCGMGSSAALSVVRAEAVNQIFHLTLTPSLINSIAYDLEKAYHGSPSGVDNTIATVGGFIWYRKEFEFLKNIWQLPMKVSQNLDHFVLINTGAPVESTGDMVEMVKIKKAKDPKIQTIFNDIEAQTKKMLLALRGESPRDLSASLSANGELLVRLGVVGKKAQRIMKEIEKIGGVSKVTGAGGVQEGSGMLLCWSKQPQDIIDFAQSTGFDAFSVKLGQPGLTVHRDEN